MDDADRHSLQGTPAVETALDKAVRPRVEPSNRDELPDSNSFNDYIGFNSYRGFGTVVTDEGVVENSSAPVSRDQKRPSNHDHTGQGLLDVRGEDLGTLVSQDRSSGMKTALDKILSLNYSSNIFNNYI